MTDERARQIVADGFCARLGTTSADGWPYVVPMLYVDGDGQIYVHNSRMGTFATTSTTIHGWLRDRRRGECSRPRRASMMSRSTRSRSIA